MQQEQFLRMQALGQEAERLEQQMQVIEQQIAELGAIRETLDELEKKDSGKSKQILANLGKGIFIEAEIKAETPELFVNVGKGSVAKKSIGETRKVIDEQTSRLLEGKEQIISRIQNLQENMQEVLMDLQKAEKNAEHSAHSKNCECEDGEECDCEEPCDDCHCGHKH